MGKDYSHAEFFQNYQSIKRYNINLIFKESLCKPSRSLMDSLAKLVAD